MGWRLWAEENGTSLDLLKGTGLPRPPRCQVLRGGGEGGAATQRL